MYNLHAFVLVVLEGTIHKYSMKYVSKKLCKTLFNNRSLACNFINKKAPIHVFSCEF